MLELAAAAAGAVKRRAREWFDAAGTYAKANPNPPLPTPPALSMGRPSETT